MHIVRQMPKRRRDRTPLTTFGLSAMLAFMVAVTSFVCAMLVTQCGRTTANAPGSSSGRTSGFGPDSGGSNPSPGTNSHSTSSSGGSGSVGVTTARLGDVPIAPADGGMAKGPATARLEAADAAAPGVESADFYKLACSILEYGRRASGHPDWEQSKALARLLFDHCADLDAWMVAALMRTESGFRPDAVSPDGQNAGILQLNRRFTPMDVDPFDIHEAIPCACDKLRWWKAHCPAIDLTGAWALVDKSHSWLSHWFGGLHPPPAAHASAALVLWRIDELRRAGTGKCG